MNKNQNMSESKTGEINPGTHQTKKINQKKIINKINQINENLNFKFHFKWFILRFSVDLIILIPFFVLKKLYNLCLECY